MANVAFYSIASLGPESAPRSMTAAWQARHKVNSSCSPRWMYSICVGCTAYSAHLDRANDLFYSIYYIHISLSACNRSASSRSIELHSGWMLPGVSEPRSSSVHRRPPSRIYRYRRPKHLVSTLTHSKDVRQNRGACATLVSCKHMSRAVLWRYRGAYRSIRHSDGFQPGINIADALKAARNFEFRILNV